MRDWWALVLVAVCASCAGEGGGSGDDGGEVRRDLAMRLDLAHEPPDLEAPADGTTPPEFSGINCGAQTCTAGDVCCATQSGNTASYACAASCPDGGIAITCDGPEHCRTGSANL